MCAKLGLRSSCFSASSGLSVAAIMPTSLRTRKQNPIDDEGDTTPKSRWPRRTLNRREEMDDFDFSFEEEPPIRNSFDKNELAKNLYPLYSGRVNRWWNSLTEQTQKKTRRHRNLRSFEQQDSTDFPDYDPSFNEINDDIVDNFEYKPILLFSKVSIGTQTDEVCVKENINWYYEIICFLVGCIYMILFNRFIVYPFLESQSNFLI